MVERPPIDFKSAHVIDKGNFRVRKTLESWHTAMTVISLFHTFCSIYSNFRAFYFSLVQDCRLAIESSLTFKILNQRTPKILLIKSLFTGFFLQLLQFLNDCDELSLPFFVMQWYTFISNTQYLVLRSFFYGFKLLLTSSFLVFLKFSYVTITIYD